LLLGLPLPFFGDAAHRPQGQAGLLAPGVGVGEVGRMRCCGGGDDGAQGWGGDGFFIGA